MLTSGTKLLYSKWKHRFFGTVEPLNKKRAIKGLTSITFYPRPEAEDRLWLGPTSDTVILNPVLQPSSPSRPAPLFPPTQGHVEVVIQLTPHPSLFFQKLLGNSLLKLEGDDRLDINCTLPLTDQVGTCFICYKMIFICNYIYVY